MTKLLIVAHEAVGSMMTGPAIRCVELAKALVAHCEVTLAVPEQPDSPLPGLKIATYQRAFPDSLLALAENADVVLISGYLLEDFPALGRLERPLIVDIYDPFPVENLEVLRSQPIQERTATILRDFAVLGRLMRAGDFFICGSETQRDFWLGMLAASGRLNPLNHEADPTFRKLIDVVPMGIPDRPTAALSSVKGSFPGIEKEDFLLVWPGGAWDWLDPLSAVEAVERIAGEAPEVKLLFLGLRHPHPERVGSMRNPEAVISRAEASGMLGRQVFFNDWTPYDERVRYLRDADLAITLHFDHLEAHLAMRVRLLDCLWAETPAIVTRGDIIAEDMAQRDLATLVPPRDPAAVANAILQWRAAGKAQGRLVRRFADMAAQYSWRLVCQPLVRYVENPYRAADRVGGCQLPRRPMCIAAPGENEEDSLQRQLAGARQQLQERETELAGARDLLERIGKGRVMTLMNAVRKFMGHVARAHNS